MCLERICTRCRQSKPLGEFSPNSGGKLGRKGQCKLCANEAARERYQESVKQPVKRKQIQARQAVKYRARSPEQNRRYRRRSHLGRYGYTTETFVAYLERIGDCCEICGRSLTGYRNRHIDHDHAGTIRDVRGILCSACNYNLGYLRTVGSRHEMKALKLFLAYLDQFDQRRARRSRRPVRG